MCVWTKKRGSMNAVVLMATPCPDVFTYLSIKMMHRRRWSERKKSLSTFFQKTAGGIDLRFRRWQEGTVNVAGGGEALSSQVRVPLPVLPDFPASYAWTTEITCVWWMSALIGLFRPLKLSVFLRKWAVRVEISHTSVPIGQRKERAACIFSFTLPAFPRSSGPGLPLSVPIPACQHAAS